MISSRKALAYGAAALVLFCAGIAPDAPFGLRPFSDAQAIVGAPLTPGSVAGVARRTTRRTVAVVGTEQAAAASSQQAAVAQQQAATAQQQSATAQQQSAAAQQQQIVLRLVAVREGALGRVVGNAAIKGIASIAQGQPFALGTGQIAAVDGQMGETEDHTSSSRNRYFRILPVLARGKAARKRILERHSLAHAAERLEAHYRHLIAARDEP